MGRVIAISSGDLETTKFINEYAVNMLGGVAGKVLFIGTASKDAEGYIASMGDAFGQLGCELKALKLVAQSYTDAEIKALLSWANIIYVGGGDTIFMINTWKKYGLDVLLKDIYQSDGAILMGISAGAMCWFQCGCTDSELAAKPAGSSYGWAEDLLNIYPYAYCPHYEDRVEEFSQLMKEKDVVGLAMECNTAFVEENGQFFFLKGNDGGKAYRIKSENGEIMREELHINAK